MVDAGSEPTYAEKNRVPPPWVARGVPEDKFKVRSAGINLRCAFAPFAHKTTLGRRKNRRRRRFGASSFGAALWYFMSAP